MFISPTSSGLGLSFKDEDVYVRNGTGSDLAAGSLVIIDLLRLSSLLSGLLDADATPYGVNPGSFTVVSNAAVSVDGFPIGAIAIKDIPDGVIGRVRVRGRVRAIVGNSAAADAGQSLGVDSNGAKLETDHNASAKVYGILLEDYAGSADAIHEILFDGIGGFGLR